jgi:hypothetical protein
MAFKRKAGDGTNVLVASEYYVNTNARGAR